MANNKKELQTLLNVAEKYAKTWKFDFNTKKCKVLVFNHRKCDPDLFLDGDRLEVVSNYKYLGIWFTADGKWKLHKQTMIAKARRRAYAMLRCGASFLSVKTCVKLWETLVRPVLEIWGAGAWEGRK